MLPKGRGGRRGTWRSFLFKFGHQVWCVASCLHVFNSCSICAAVWLASSGSKSKKCPPATRAASSEMQLLAACHHGIGPVHVVFCWDFVGGVRFSSHHFSTKQKTVSFSGELDGLSHRVVRCTRRVDIGIEHTLCGTTSWPWHDYKAAQKHAWLVYASFWEMFQCQFTDSATVRQEILSVVFPVELLASRWESRTVVLLKRFWAQKSPRTNHQFTPMHKPTTWE